MISIFYDLETSDRHMCGQILNYAFIAVDNEFKILDECKGDIRISALQLPAPAAIVANGINVLEHQKLAQRTEPEAVSHIADFLEQMIDRAKGSVALIGFNAPRFDLPYLRTTFIRNGINPYFGGKLAYRDLLAVARYLSCTQKKFPRIAAQEPDRKGRLSLRLETLTKHFGLLTGKQTHASYDDTLITIELAKTFSTEWGVDVRSFEAYQGDRLPTKPRSGKVFIAIEPQYDLESKEIACPIPVSLLDQNHRYALWINLNDFKNSHGRRSIIWSTKGTSSFFTDGQVSDDFELGELAQRSLGEFANINLSNFFQRSTCDIEQDIYRLDMDDIGALYQAIWEHNERPIRSLKTRDAWVLYKRFQLANASQAEQGSAEYRSMLEKYAKYRYDGAMHMDKFQPEDSNIPENIHPKFDEMLAELETLRAANPEKKAQLDGLKKFYLSSHIAEALGKKSA
jgi:hypothetical protein